MHEMVLLKIKRKLLIRCLIRPLAKKTIPEECKMTSKRSSANKTHHHHQEASGTSYALRILLLQNEPITRISPRIRHLHILFRTSGYIFSLAPKELVQFDFTGSPA
jgi:hypothetical protein